MINYFISDLHLGHSNILEYTSRKGKFTSIEQMNEQLVQNILDTVKTDGRLVLLGDICWNRKSFQYLKHFPKNTILVGGNHDVSSSHYEAYRDAGWKIVGCMQHSESILTHIPVHPRQLEERFQYNIHGHLHDNHVMREFQWMGSLQVRKDPRYLNVSCEVIGYRPKTYEQLLEHYGLAVE